MKKNAKILSVTLALVLALMAVAIPASAAVPTPTVKADVVAEYQGKTSGGYDYYKFSVYIDSTLSLNGIQCNVSWDGNAWTLLRANNKNDATAFNAQVMDRTDPKNVLYKYTDYYDEYGLDGSGNGQWDCDAIGDGYAYLAADGAAPSIANISDTNLGATLVDAGYEGAYMAWAVPFTDSYLNISGGTVNQANSPDSGRVMVMSWYMRLNDGVAPGRYEVGFNAAQAYRLTAQYNYYDAIASRDIGLDMGDIPADSVTYTNAIIDVGTEGPAVAKSKAELKFTLTSPTTVADPFTLRVTSVITDADWDAYFANTAVADATTNAIQRLGFVAYRGTDGFDMDTAKAVAQGTATEGYDVAWTDYIQKTSDTADAYFGARLEITSVDTRTDVTYVGVVEYLDANNQTAYAFYDAEQEALLDQNYTTYVQQYVDTYGSDYVA